MPFITNIKYCMSSNFTNMDECVKNNKISSDRSYTAKQKKVYFYDKKMITDNLRCLVDSLIDEASLTKSDVGLVVVATTILDEFIVYNRVNQIKKIIQIPHANYIELGIGCNTLGNAISYCKSKMRVDSSLKNAMIISICQINDKFFDRLNIFSSTILSDNITALIIKDKEEHRSFEILESQHSTLTSYADLTMSKKGSINDFNSKKSAVDMIQIESAEMLSKEEKYKIFNDMFERTSLLFNEAKKNIKKNEFDYYILMNMFPEKNLSMCNSLGIDTTKSSIFLNEIIGHAGPSDIAINLFILEKNKTFKNNDLIYVNAMGFGFAWCGIILKYIKLEE